MPDELDIITARLVSELSANMLPALSKSLNSVVHVDDVVNALDRTSMITQDLRNQIEKAVRSGIDESRAGRSMIIQSVRTAVEEISGLRKLLEKMSRSSEAESQNNKPDENMLNVLQELAGISELLNELISGLSEFSQTYAKDHTKKDDKETQTQAQNFETLNDAQILSENNSRLDKLINNSLPGLEGLVKAHEKTQSHELEEFSKEISTLHEQNNLALIHEIREDFNNELTKISEEILERVDEEREKHNAKNSLILKILIGISGANLIFILIVIFMLMWK